MNSNAANVGVEMKNSTCVTDVIFYNTSFGAEWAMPEWEAITTIVTLTLCILLTIVGNVLVILSVFTYKPLRIVQNFFIVSLAVADLTVATLVMPLNVAYSVLGRWEFGSHVCKMWLTSDVLCCTASILNLCAIALDRFWAITDPINYAQKRTVKRVLLMIAGVWIVSLLISSPPLIGWNDWSTDAPYVCKLTERQGYVVYSSLGSFFIPLFIMTIVYVEIFIATKRRLRERAQASKIGAISKTQSTANRPKQNHDRDSISSETNHNEHPDDPEDKKTKSNKHKRNKKKKKNLILRGENDSGNHLKPILINEDSFTDNANSTSRKNSFNSTMQTEAKTSVIIEVPQRNNDRKTTENNENTKRTGTVYQFIEEKQRISLSKERRAARTLGIIMGVFVVCWLPFFLMYVIIPFCPSCCPSHKLKNFITWLGYVNSVLNPIIYTIFNLDFRRAFRNLLGMRA